MLSQGKNFTVLLSHQHRSLDVKEALYDCPKEKIAYNVNAFVYSVINEYK